MKRDRKVIFNVAKSSEEAEKFNVEDNLSLSPEERLDLMQVLRERYYKINKNESRKRLRRFPKVVKGRRS